MASDDLEGAADRAALAAILHARGRHQEARETLREVLATQEAVLGPDHYEVALTLNDLGVMHICAGRFAEADAALSRAVTIFERVLGRAHATSNTSRALRARARARKNGRDA